MKDEFITPATPIFSGFLQVGPTWSGCVRCPATFTGPDSHEQLMEHLRVAHPDWMTDRVVVNINTPKHSCDCEFCTYRG